MNPSLIVDYAEMKNKWMIVFVIGDSIGSFLLKKQ
jgi:hypothetical protein